MCSFVQLNGIAFFEYATTVGFDVARVFKHCFISVLPMLVNKGYQDCSHEQKKTKFSIKSVEFHKCTNSITFFFHVTLLFYYFEATRFPIALFTAGQQERCEKLNEKIIRLICSVERREKKS